MIYLLHLEPGLKRSNGSVVNHYLGWCQEYGLLARLEAHQKGRSGAKLVEAAVKAGSTVTLVKTWPHGGPALERHLKNMGHLKEKCPKCEKEANWVRNVKQAQRRARKNGTQLELWRTLPEGYGSALLPLSPGPAPSRSGTFPRAPRQAPTTSSGLPTRGRRSGGTNLPATARQLPPDDT